MKSVNIYLFGLGRKIIRKSNMKDLMIPFRRKLTFLEILERKLYLNLVRLVLGIMTLISLWTNAIECGLGYILLAVIWVIILQRILLN